MWPHQNHLCGTKPQGNHSFVPCRQGIEEANPLLTSRSRHARRSDQAPSTTGLLMDPTPSTETVTSSPATSGPTPAGVPVRTRSPGSNVITCEMKRNTTSTGKINAEVLSDCFNSPFTRLSTRTPFQGSISSVTIGPTGQNVSKPLARVHCGSFFCRSRAVTSLAQV